jgi:hypothetical protein
VSGSDFEFTTKVELKKLNDGFATAEPVRFLLPKGLRQGPQDYMDVQIATESLVPGGYELLITQQDGNSHPVKFKVLPNPPKVDNLPILVNQGAGTQHYVLKGERLGLITGLEAAGAILSLSSPDANQTERSLTAELKSSPKPGTRLPVKVYLQDRTEPLEFPNALEITGPLPLIASARLSLPAGLAIAIRSGEFPAGYTLNVLMDVKNIERTSTLRLGCADGVGEQAPLHIGEKSAHWSLQQLSPDQLFLAFDNSPLPAGCSLQATIDNGREGRSQPFTLAHILRIPKSDSFTVSEDPRPDGLRQYHLTGENLEMIQKIGWTENDPVNVSTLPMPLPGPGLKQSLDFRLPDPSNADPTLRIWLRGDQEGRATTIKAPALPGPPPAEFAPQEPPKKEGQGNHLPV